MPEVVPPTVTVAFVTELFEAEDVCRIAIVSPLFTPDTGPATKPAPLMEMPVHPALQVAVKFVNPPASVTVLLVMVELMGWPVTFVKLKALAVGSVVTLQAVEVVPPMVTVAVVGVL